jgi:hypothetical protein
MKDRHWAIWQDFLREERREMISEVREAGSEAGGYEDHHDEPKTCTKKVKKGKV